jgi:gas vesicle protein
VKTPHLIIAIILAATTLLVTPALAKKKEKIAEPKPTTVAEAETNYTQTIEKRAADILSALDLKDAAKSARVHDTVVAQYRALRDWQATNEAQIKRIPNEAMTDLAERIERMRAARARKALHDQFIARLSRDLSPNQLETVKDKMTYGKVKVTYDLYCEIVPELTEEHKGRILQLLKEAREEAMDGVTAAEKTAIFQKYKGKINIYLNAEGVNVGKAYKDWGAKMKEKGSKD